MKVLRDCPSDVADAVVAAGGPRPTMVYNLRGRYSVERDEDDCIDFFKCYTGSGFDPFISRDDDLGNGTHRIGVIPGRISAATAGREPVAALLKSSTNIFVGFVFDTDEPGVQEIVHTQAEPYTDNDGELVWEDPPGGWCVHCGDALDEYYETYSDGMTQWHIDEECWESLGYERCYCCGETYQPDSAMLYGSVVPEEGWMCNYCFERQYPERAEQWDDLEDAQRDALHDEALVYHEQLVGAAAGQQVMDIGGDDVGTP